MGHFMVLLLSFQLFLLTAHCQFPAVATHQKIWKPKHAVPMSVEAPPGGSCVNITSEVMQQWNNANSTIVGILRDTPNQPAKGTADARYLWPTVVFEHVCSCSGNYGGYNCMECDFGWEGTDCQTRKEPVIRKHFASLTKTEKNAFVDATKATKE